MGIRDEIEKAAVQMLSQAPEGIRFMEFWQRLKADLPDANENTIAGTLATLEQRRKDEVARPARGLYLHAKYRQAMPPQLTPRTATAHRPKEGTFYEPFAEWLVNELEECTKAIAVGGNRFGNKWGTPDVIGVREPKKSDIIKFGTEIVAAEVKLDTAGLITAFGQACAYRLFSHKSYIVVPLSSPEEDLARLDVLCRIFGIGLILFDEGKPEEPAFQIRVRAAKHEPDMFYVNQCMRAIEDDLFG